MNFCRIAMASVAVAACALMTGCAQDTPKSVFQNSEEYSARVFVPSVLSSSVRETASDSKPMPFSKITLTRSAKVMEQGTLIDFSADVTYENAGQGLVREIDVGYKNGVEENRQFNLSYRGLLALHEQDIRSTYHSTYQKMPYTLTVSSLSHFDSSFDQPNLSYVYRMSSDNPRYKSVDRSLACTMTRTYAGSKLAAGISGNVREFECKFYNDNGVVDTNSTYVYLDDYGVAVLKQMVRTEMKVYWTISNFKAG